MKIIARETDELAYLNALEFIRALIEIKLINHPILEDEGFKKRYNEMLQAIDNKLDPKYYDLSTAIREIIYDGNLIMSYNVMSDEWEENMFKQYIFVATSKFQGFYFISKQDNIFEINKYAIYKDKISKKSYTAMCINGEYVLLDIENNNEKKKISRQMQKIMHN